MISYLKVFAVLGICLASLLAFAKTFGAQETPTTAIDIALEPDNTMIQHAQAVNTRLLKVFPKGFALGPTHHPHISMLQRYVRTGDLDKFTQWSGRSSTQSVEKRRLWSVQTRSEPMHPECRNTGRATALEILGR